ncbi:hypothetical protein [Micromonospora sp. HUAS LYJ1]|uniref:hypothetical protein n=1 Tax=Micromonospora sp. HUAS LYJ1 TaxID=3061626 RepID=UPI002670E747|nr:hypothetical protein [Micromonospora sp. HUAS LYJ1]WKU03359.1 hypothetical protein Q2K16_21185 [Micromonospora sp. HUAS LYJ1]
MTLVDELKDRFGGGPVLRVIGVAVGVWVLRLNASRLVVLCLVGVPGGFVLVWGSLVRQPPFEIMAEVRG